MIEAQRDPGQIVSRLKSASVHMAAKTLAVRLRESAWPHCYELYLNLDIAAVLALSHISHLASAIILMASMQMLRSHSL